MVYIFLSAFLIGQIFPREKIVLLRLYSLTEENRDEGLEILAEFFPTYHTVRRKEGESQEKTVFVVSCYLSK